MRIYIVECGCPPVAIFGKAHKQNPTGISIIVTSASHLDNNLVRHMAFIF